LQTKNQEPKDLDIGILIRVLEKNSTLSSILYIQTQFFKCFNFFLNFQKNLILYFSLELKTLKALRYLKTSIATPLEKVILVAYKEDQR
jgi:hypothetical protein